MLGLENTITTNKIKHKNLINRNYIYLQLLEKRLKKFEYLEKHNNDLYDFSSSDNTFLEKQNYSEIIHSDKYYIRKYLDKNETMILKQLLEENINHNKIFTNQLEKPICFDQEIYASTQKIHLRYLGFKKYYQILEKLYDYDIVLKCNHLEIEEPYVLDYDKKYYHILEDLYNYDKKNGNFIYCLDTSVIGELTLHDTTIFVFEVLEDNFDKKYIFFSNYSRRFYKTNELIKLDYLANNISEYELQIFNKINEFKTNNFKLETSENTPNNSYLYLYTPSNKKYMACLKNLDLYTKNT